VHRTLISLSEDSDPANPNHAATEFQIERILQSETLRSSEALRRLSGTGEQFALVTTTPGPLGKGVVRAFESIGTSARLAAVQAFSDPAAARILLSKLRDRSGSVPLYFQLLLKVSYKNGVATDLEYVLHRELSLKKSI